MAVLSRAALARQHTLYAHAAWPVPPTAPTGTALRGTPRGVPYGRPLPARPRWLLVPPAPPAVTDAFRATRLGGDRGHSSGTLPAAAGVGGIAGQVLPERG
ncbi:hypothetical protein HTV45_24895 [Streptomyces sp. CHD11]|uniref:hypothetical protein n=1 Tax=Streptomyces sp. CHD11 TaxID=2741325 RepID=UPI001BFCB79D|nr:hypothetical protein [Streptomyces sp. CHD11]MBT3154067.1 hypothetical protein [Streptomyces sp. CHD11]